jgi:D-alanyl-D-alanine carboxypeptidase (penicillin-binding protein 5/6)
MKAMAGRLAGREQFWPGLAAGLGIALLSALFAFQIVRPPPMITPTILQPSSSQLGPTPPAFPWPQRGSAAVAIENLGTVGSFGPQTPQPLASTAKIMTALLLLQDAPLQLAQQGPLVPVTPTDVATYQTEKADGQSVFPVAAGEQLTEYQALQALLIPSGNNVADLLEGWDAGSTVAFVAKMNAQAAKLGLGQTHYADVTGVSRATTGSPRDLITIAEVAMHDPVFAQIVGMPDATLPVAGHVFNVNADLGQDGIIGVKTGSTSAAGACLVFAADVTADEQPARIFGVVMGLPTLDDAFTAARSLIEAISPRLHYRTLVSTLQTLVEYQAPWGDNAYVFSQQDVNLVVYDGMTLRLHIDARTLTAPAPSGSHAGSLTIQVGEHTTQMPLQTTYSIDQPGFLWRIIRTQLF